MTVVAVSISVVAELVAVVVLVTLDEAVTENVELALVDILVVGVEQPDSSISGLHFRNKEPGYNGYSVTLKSAKQLP